MDPQTITHPAVPRQCGLRAPEGSCICGHVPVFPLFFVRCWGRKEPRSESLPCLPLAGLADGYTI